MSSTERSPWDGNDDDRKHAMMGESAKRPTENWVTLVTGWFQELHELAPAH